MIIGIDIRCLSQERHTGVEEYTINLLKSLLKLDQDNKYKLFYNSHKTKSPAILGQFLKYNNVKLFKFQYPNKILNSSFRFLRKPKIDQMIGGVDIFFTPNIIFSSVGNCKKVITFHDLSFERYPEFFSKKRKLWHNAVNPKMLANESDKIIVVSESTKQDLIELYGIHHDKIKVIYSGIESKFSPVTDQKKLKEVKKKYNLPENFILYLGTLEPRKNIEGLIFAFDRLKNIHNLSLVIAGEEGWLYGNIYKAASSAKAKRNIQFAGFIDPKDKPALYSLAKLFVYPSFWEGFGFPPLEAMACGTPVITSHVSSLPEVVGEAGLLVDPYNINELSEAIYQVLTDENLRNNLKLKGVQRAKKFSWQKAAEETLKVFKSLT